MRFAVQDERVVLDQFGGGLDVGLGFGALGRVVARLLGGVGMVAVVAPDAVDASLASLASNGVDAWVMGEVTTGEGVDLA